MITREELIRMRNMTFDEIDPDDAIDLDDLDVDVTLSKQEKILNILNSGKNPYFCKSQGYLQIACQNGHLCHIRRTVCA